jgi:hypothetical protein
MGPFVGVIETICGALIIIGLLTRLAAIPLIIIMIVAIVSTKSPILAEVRSRFVRHARPRLLEFSPADAAALWFWSATAIKDLRVPLRTNCRFLP